MFLIRGNDNVNNVSVNIFQDSTGGVGASILDQHGSSGDNYACGGSNKFKHPEDRGTVFRYGRICQGIFCVFLVIWNVVDSVVDNTRDMEVLV